jgi:predicted lipoprotein with Yx(FWY)xxD motif
MTRNRLTTFLAGAAVVPLAGLAVAGCGSGGSNATGATTPPAPPKTANGRPANVGVAKTNLGNVLVDSHGRTIYLFGKDSGTKSSCFGECANDWPPVRAAGKPAIGRGLDASTTATTARSDGNPQISYNGHPLYLYIGDHKPGDTNGQGITAFGAPWYALSAAGNQVSGQASNTGGGNGGY